MLRFGPGFVVSNHRNPVNSISKQNGVYDRILFLYKYAIFPNSGLISVNEIVAYRCSRR